MDTESISLAKLVDLALCTPEAGVVNFNYLRTLLLQIVKLTNHQDTKFDVEKIILQQDDAQDLKNEVKSNDSYKYPSSKDIMEKFERISKDNEKLQTKLEALENDLDSWKHFQSNSTIIESSDKQNDGNTEVTKNPGKQLSSTWQHIKHLQRIEGLETGVDKLFSLMNDLLTKRRKWEEQFAAPHLHKNKELRQLNGEKGSNEHNTDQTIKADQLDKVHDEINNLKSLYAELANSKEDIVEINNNSEKFDNGVDISKLTEYVTDNKKNIENNANVVTTLEKQCKDFDGKCNKNDKDIDILRSQLEKFTNDLATLNNSSNDNGISQNPERIKIGDHIEKKTDVLEQNVKKLQEKLKDLEEQLKLTQTSVTEKPDVSSLKHLETEKKLSEKIQTHSEDINKLQESIQNIDNSELDAIMKNMSELRKMSSEIEELRKLSDLKDLADNVESLKDLRKELDQIKLSTGGNTSSLEKQNIEILERLAEYEKSQQNIDGKLNIIAIALDEHKNDTTKGREFMTKEEMKNYLDQLSMVNGRHSDYTDKKNEEKVYEMQLSTGQDDLYGKVTALEKSQRTILSNMNELVEAQRKNEHLRQINDQRPPSPVFDTSVLAAIQHLAQQNRQQISTIQADLNFLKKIKTAPAVSETTNTAAIEMPDMEGIHNHLGTLQEEQVRLSGKFEIMLEDTKDEFLRKQQHIDALYGYIETLQNNKADKDDITSEMDVKADKQALDNKVNMSTFDERYQLLEQALQNALNRLDQFVEQEASLKDSLSKLHSDLDSKMDSDAEKKLKKFLDDRLKDIQKSRKELSIDEDMLFDYRNAAGLRKPMPLQYHCISCDRPVDVSLRGVMSDTPQRFPSKKSMGPYKSFELDQLRHTRKIPTTQQSFEKISRPCGGPHTSVNNIMYRNHKNQLNDAVDGLEKGMEMDNQSFTECVIGKDGQIYRGRFKLNQLPPPLTKRINHNIRNKHHSKHRFAHSATVPPKENNLTIRDENRALSANEKSCLAKNGSSNHSNSSSGESPVNPHLDKREESLLTLPPISRDGSLVADDNGMTDSIDLQK